MPTTSFAHGLYMGITQSIFFDFEVLGHIISEFFKANRMVQTAKLYILSFKITYIGPHFCTEAYMGDNGFMALKLPWEVKY